MVNGTTVVGSPSTPLELSALDSLDFTVAYGMPEGPKDCSVSFTALFQGDRSPIPERFLTATKVPDGLVKEIEAILGRSPVTLGIRPSTKSLTHAPVSCTPLGNDNKLPDDAATKDYDLLVKVAGGLCVPLVVLRTDPRRLVVEQGRLQQEFFVSASDSEPPVVFKDAAEKALCHLEGNGTPTAAVDCPAAGYQVPKTERLPARTVSLRSAWVRVISSDATACPPEPGPADTELVITPLRNKPPEGMLCVYVYGADGPPTRLLPQDLLQTVAPGVLLQSCASANDAQCIPAQPPSELLELSSRSDRVHIQLRKNDRPALRLELEKLKVSPPIGPPEAKRQRYVDPAKLTEELDRALCLPIDTPRADAARITPPKSLTVSIHGDAVPTSGWEVRTQQGLVSLCPKDNPLRVQDIDQYKSTLQKGENGTSGMLVIVHRLGGEELSTLTFTSVADIPIKSISIREAAGPKKLGKIVGSYAATRTPLTLGDWLCIETGSSLSESESFPISPSRISMVNRLSGKTLGTFAAGPQTTLNFDKFAALDVTENAGGGVHYCAPMAKPGGDDGLTFTPTDGSVEQTMSFAWDNNVKGCQGGNRDGGQCGSLSPDIGYFAGGGDAIKFSHIDVGVWQTTVDTSRVRISAMVPVFALGVGVPGVVSLAVEGGGAVPITLSSQPNKAPDAQSDEAFVGVGVGAYASVCLKVHVQLAPRVCGGAMADAGLDLNQRSDGRTTPKGVALASYFIAVGAGIR